MTAAVMAHFTKPIKNSHFMTFATDTNIAEMPFKNHILVAIMEE